MKNNILDSEYQLQLLKELAVKLKNKFLNKNRKEKLLKLKYK
jgi:hypothetical protein